MPVTIYESSFPPVQSWSTKTDAFSLYFSNNPCINPTSTALIDGQTGETTTYASLISESLRYAQGYTDHLPKESTILLFAPNSTLYPVLLLAGLAGGFVVTTANPAYTVEELVYQIRDSRATTVISCTAGLEAAKEAARESGIGEVWVIGGGEGDKKVEGLRSGRELVRNERIGVGGERIAILPYSSGTTGRAKGVKISHANLVSVSQQARNVPFLSGREITSGPVPMFHMYGMLILLLHTFYNGGTAVVLAKFELSTFLSAIERYKSTTVLVVPPVALLMAKSSITSTYDLSSIKTIMCGAAPLSSDLQAQLEARLPGRSIVVQGYGLTESTTIVLLPDIANPVVGSCGRLIPSMQARLVNEEGQDVQEGQMGELWVRGPNIMVGYHGNEEATRNTINRDGWFMTGDVCVRSSSGDYTIVDRTKELIKYSGFQVPPAELEAVLLACPLVADAAVIGVWDDSRATELPRAYIVPDANHLHDVDLIEKIQEFVTSKVAPHKKLRGGVFIIDVIPKSASGKILRKDLRTLAAQSSSPIPKL